MATRIQRRSAAGCARALFTPRAIARSSPQFPAIPRKTLVSACPAGKQALSERDARNRSEPLQFSPCGNLPHFGFYANPLAYCPIPKTEGFSHT